MIHFCVKVRKKYMCCADTEERQQGCAFYKTSNEDRYCQFNREFYSEPVDDLCRSIAAKSCDDPGRDLIGLTE
jgi:hypothetical protein